MYTLPSIASSSKGVCSTTDPIFESDGQPFDGSGWKLSSVLAYPAGVQTPNPSACEGLIVTPTGSVTFTPLISELEIPSGFSRPGLGTSTWTARPDGVSVSIAVGDAFKLPCT